MARPRAASDEEILTAAEELAKDVGWQNVYAPTVHTHMNVGGSLSTFSKVIKNWRAEKEAEQGSQKTQVAEIVKDRVSVIDDGMSAIVETLKKLSETVNAEIDRSVADERRKSDRLRADDKAAHDKAMEDLRARMEAMSTENDALANEATAEAERADRAEDENEKLKSELADVAQQLNAAEAEAQKVQELEYQLKQAKENAQNEIQAEKTRADKAWDRVEQLEKKLPIQKAEG